MIFFKLMTFQRHTVSPTTIWTRYSMLKAVIQGRHNIKIDYPNLVRLLKKNAVGYQQKKAKVFRSEEIERFLSEADDQQYLAGKVVVIFGIYGATRAVELTKCDVKDVKAEGEIYLVSIPDTKTNVQRKFCIDVQYATYVRKYINLRPRNVVQTRFFINYQKGKCTQPPIGRNKFLNTPKLVADFLHLENAELYTGHSFRRTSASFVAESGASMLTLQTHGGWKSPKTAQGYVDNSDTHKEIVGNIITRQIQKKAKIVTSTMTSSQVVIKEQTGSSSAVVSEPNCANIDAITKGFLEHIPVTIRDCENFTVNFNFGTGGTCK